MTSYPSLATALAEYIRQNPLVMTGLQLEILNFAALARAIAPQISARTGQKVSVNALHKALTRVSIKETSKKRALAKIRLQALSIRGDLMVVTCLRSPKNHALVAKWYDKARQRNQFFNVTEGIQEITLVCENILGLEIIKNIPTVLVVKNIASIQASFHRRYLSQPGFIVSILQQLSNQGINIVEVSSTATELVIFVASKQVTVAFDTLYYAFIERST